MYKHNLDRTAEYSVNWTDDRVLLHLIKTANPVIFDVGANKGQSATRFRNIWPTSRIICFDPLPDCIEHLIEQGYEAYEIALGEANTTSKFYRNTLQPALCSVYHLNMQSKDSIALNQSNIAGIDEQTYRESANISFQANVRTLDSICKDLGITHIDFLKMDVQGSEPMVLRGAKQMLKYIDVIQCEVMLYDLYTHSNSIGDLENLMPGFKLWDISHISKNPMNGRTDWIDVIYVRDTFPT